MNKLYLAIVAGLMLLILGGTAGAAEKKFKDLTLSVDGTCSAQESDGMVTVKSDAGHFFSISFMPPEDTKGAKGMDPKAFAEALATTLGGTAPEKDKAGDYGFNVIKNGTDMHVIVVNKDKFIALYMHDRKDSDWPPCLEAAFESVKGNSLEIQGFLTTYVFVDR